MSGVDPINYDVGELRQLATEDDEDPDERREPGDADRGQSGEPADGGRDRRPEPGNSTEVEAATDPGDASPADSGPETVPSSGAPGTGTADPALDERGRAGARATTEERPAGSEDEHADPDDGMEKWTWGPTDGVSSPADDGSRLEGSTSEPESVGASTDAKTGEGAGSGSDDAPSGGDSGAESFEPGSEEGSASSNAGSVSEALGEVRSKLRRLQNRDSAAERSSGTAPDDDPETGASLGADEDSDGTTDVEDRTGRDSTGAADVEDWTPWESDVNTTVTPAWTDDSAASDDASTGVADGARSSPDTTAGRSTGETTTERTGGGDTFTYRKDSAEGSTVSISDEVAAALDAGSILGGGPGDLLALEDLGEKPFLAFVPEESTDVVDEWMQFLVGRAGTDGALTAVDAYASAEWVTVGVAVDLQSRIRDLEHRSGDYDAMGRGDHLQSLQYIYKIT